MPDTRQYDAGSPGVGNDPLRIDKLVARSTSLADNSRLSYEQVVDLMNTAKRLRRRAASALKVVSDLDETAVADGQPQQQRALALQEAARNVESVETQARMLVGRFLGRRGAACRPKGAYPAGGAGGGSGRSERVCGAWRVPEDQAATPQSRLTNSRACPQLGDSQGA